MVHRLADSRTRPRLRPAAPAGGRSRAVSGAPRGARPGQSLLPTPSPSPAVTLPSVRHKTPRNQADHVPF
ncbi:hypothetical protein ADK86_10170 [Streptomyces sp. NRRL F-5755]|nr:hypothetical protein ADK86_10170 [Streptomyces sp. NRRL F-5755]